MPKAAVSQSRPKQTRNVAEESRRRTEHGKRRQASQQRADVAQQLKERQALEERGRRESVKYFRQKCLPAIKEAESKGEYEAFIFINWSDDTTLNASQAGMVDGAIERLRRDGYRAERNAEFNKRFGSDDPYGNQYAHTLKISWKVSNTK